MDAHAEPRPGPLPGSDAGRRERRKADTRRRLLEAARRLFAEHGYDATRPQDIAREADVAAGTFYVHFADKREAFLAFTEQVADELLAHMAASARNAKDRDLAATLDRALASLFDYSRDNPGLLRAVSADAAVASAALPPGASLRERLAQTLAERLRRAAAEGEIPKSFDPELIAHGAVGFLHAALVHAGGRAIDRRRVLDNLRQFLRRALLVETPPSPRKVRSAR